MKDFFTYFFAALSALTLDYILSAFCLYVGLAYYIGLLFGTVAGGVLGFVLMSFWVFPTKEGVFALRRVGGYLAGMGLVYVVRTIVMWIWYGLALPEAWQYIGLICAFGCSFMINFFFQKYVVFVRTV